MHLKIYFFGNIIILKISTQKGEKMILKNLVLLIAFISSGVVFAAVDMKKEYKELKMSTEKQIKVIDKKLKKVGQKVDKLQGTAKVELEKSYDEMLKMKNNLVAKLSDAGNTSTELWEDTKDKVEDYADDLESRVDKAIN